MYQDFIGIAGWPTTCQWIGAMLDPGVFVSQQVTTRYVLLARQHCDGCVTIGSNGMYGGWGVCGGWGHCTECGVSWHSETWRTNCSVKDMLRVQHPADVSSLGWEMLCLGPSSQPPGSDFIRGAGGMLGHLLAARAHVHTITQCNSGHNDRDESGQKLRLQAARNPSRCWMCSECKASPEVFH